MEKEKGNHKSKPYFRNPVHQGYGIGLVVILGLTLLLAPSPASFPTLLGLAVLVAVLLGILYLDIRRYRPALIADPWKIVLLGILLVGTIAVDRFGGFLVRTFAEEYPWLDPGSLTYVLPTAAAAMLATMLLDAHLGLTISFVLSLLVGIAFPEQPFLPIYTFVGCVVAIFGVLSSRRRTHVLKAGGMVVLANLLMVIALGLYRSSDFNPTIMADMAFGIGGGVMVALIASGTLPMLESFFKITTNNRLLELLDLNQPLLKKLKQDAPGTYYHSMMVSQVAESAAEAIGENPVFVRACCYYHDIGKMLKPQYFIENQTDPINQHDKLNPHLSSLIVMSHVKGGIDLARKYGLPESIIDMIPQHHGTRVINFFYGKAQKTQNPVLPPVGDQEFRYPGPKPQSKVAAVIMLADSVEASCRTLSNPIPQRISGLVDNIVTGIYLDGQLDESDLTLKDLKTIQENLKIVLNRQYHRRIQYPDTGPDPDHKVKDERSNQKPASKENRSPQIIKGISRKNPAQTGAA